MGCEVQACLKNYHFFCAKNDNAVLQTDGSQGIYKYLIKQFKATFGGLE